MAERLMKSFLAHPGHHRIFAAGVNLDPPPAGDVRRWGGAESAAKDFISKYDDFGIWLNGGILLGPAHYEVISRARVCGGENCWQMFSDIVNQFRKDNLCGGPVFDEMDDVRRLGVTPQLFFTGKNAYTWVRGPDAEAAGSEPYLTCGGALLWGLYTGIFGIAPDFQGLTLTPRVPKALAGTELSIRLMGKRLTIHYTGHGDTLAELRINDTPVELGRISWDSLPDGAAIECLMRD